jgi:nucleoside-diphosphate-sugar epimerase
VKALVTGSAGFLGRHFSAELEQRGWTVNGCDIDGDLHGEAGTDAHAVFAGDHYRDRYDLVVHCAALEPHRKAIDSNPLHMAANLRLDADMFRWAVTTGQRRVLYLSSSAAYPVDLQTGAFRRRMWRLAENDLRPDEPGLPDAGYGWTKLTGERLARDAGRAGLAVHVVRPFSGYGSDQSPLFPFGAFIDRAWRRVDPFPIWGDGQQVRDFIHVDDLVAGALAVVDADERRPVNLCTGVGTTMLELAEMVCEQVDYQPHFEVHPDQPTGVHYRVGEPYRLRPYHLPTIGVRQGIARALADRAADAGLFAGMSE